MQLTDIDPTLEPFPLMVHDDGDHGPPLPLMLHRRRVEGGRPVLLLHGASASSDTFLTPRPGAGGCLNLVDYLEGEGYEPWLLDWRSSKRVADEVLGAASARGAPAPDGRRFNFDAAAEHDIKAALDVIVKERKGSPIDAIGFCMGGAILAQALLHDLQGVSDRLSHVVLMTLGLFYSMNLHGRLKAEARLLERVASEDASFRFLDPRVKPGHADRIDWPSEIAGLYGLWRRPYDEGRLEAVLQDDRYVLEIFNRVSFMFGEPYLDGNLVPEIHNSTWVLPIGDSPLRDGQQAALPVGLLIRSESIEGVEGRLAYPFTGAERMVLSGCRGEFHEGQALLADGRPVGRVAGAPARQAPVLPDLFGAMAVHLHIHGSENLRAGQATRFSSEPVVPVPHINGGGAELYAGFDRLERTTLIGGALNRLWHRDSIDRMAAWLGRNRGRGGRRFEKHILPDFGHQDLLWGRNAAKDVFPLIEAGLGGTCGPTWASRGLMRSAPARAARSPA